MKYLLHIDTSTDTGLVAISEDGHLLGYRTTEEPRNHAGAINNMIHGLLADLSIPIKNLSCIVVCAGPGSYTGLRIGVATAKGVCYALDKPLILDNLLTLLAYQAWYKNNGKHLHYVSLLTARANEYFISIYDDNFTCILPPRHVMEDKLAGLMEKGKDKFIITNVPENTIIKLKIDNFIIDPNIKIDLTAWSSFAYGRYKRNDFDDLSYGEPFYLKQVYTHK